MEPSTTNGPDAQKVKPQLNWKIAAPWGAGLYWALYATPAGLAATSYHDMEGWFDILILLCGAAAIAWLIVLLYTGIVKRSMPTLLQVMWGTTVLVALSAWGGWNHLPTNLATSNPPPDALQSTQVTTEVPPDPAPGNVTASLTPDNIKDLEQKAAQGDAEAQFELGVNYYKLGNIAMAIELYKKAAYQGNAGAEFDLGVMYQQGIGVPKDANAAIAWYDGAAVQGNSNAENNLGLMYEQGDGVPKDATKAAEWLQKSATQGNDEAEVGLGFLYYNGSGVPKDASKAVEWWQKSAAKGNASAQGDLAASYAEGVGVSQDNVLGYAWFNLAASQGDVQAAAARTNLEKKMTPEQISEAQHLSSSWVKGQILVRGGAR